MSDYGSPPAGVATGVGSLPGTDPAEAVALVFDELPDLPYLPELPARGPWAELIGRSAALLVDLPVDLQPTGWRMVPRPGRDQRRASDLLARDLDALQEHAGEYDGWLKLQAAGPWTLTAGIELHRGDRVLADPIAVQDLAESLAEGLRLHLADVVGRLPRATLLLQLDEPSLPAVLAARVPTASGFGTLRGVSEQQAAEILRPLLAGLSGTPLVVHCCAADPPLRLLTDLSVSLSLDLSQLGTAYDDDLGSAVEAGLPLHLGVVPAVDGAVPDGPAPVRDLWGRLGFPVEQLASTVVVTPQCGLAGASPAYARQAMAVTRKLASQLLD